MRRRRAPYATILGVIALCAAMLTTLMLPTSQALAADKVRGNIGVGLGRGTGVWGLSGKLYMGEATSVQVVAGGGSNYLGLSADLLLEMPALAQLGPLEIAWAVGAGLGLGVSDSSLGAAIAGVLGLELNFSIIPSLPFDLVFEWRPGLSVVPDVSVGLLGLTGHVRVYF